jgi:hypothetical protein
MGDPSAGWYPNPDDPSREWYWDGKKWSGDTRPVAPLGDAAPTPEDPAAVITELAVEGFKLSLREEPESRVQSMLSIGILLVTGKEAADLRRDEFPVANGATRLGYATRAVEYRTFVDNDTARSADWRELVMQLYDDQLVTADDRDDAMVQMATKMVTAEPLEPRPEDSAAPSNLLPGIPSKLRATLCEVSMTEVVRLTEDGTLTAANGPVTDLTYNELARTWKYGFFLRSIEEEVFAAEHGRGSGMN